MIHSKQNWTVGQTVKVGFMTLIVQAAIATPGDHLPDVYFLSNVAGTKLYEFVPHHGLRAVSLDEAEAKIADLRRNLERITAQEANRSAQRAAAVGAMRRVFGQAIAS